VTGEGGAQILFNQIVDAAIFVTHADAGTVQLFEPESETLRILASQGLPAAITDRLAVIKTNTGTPGEVALRDGNRCFTDFEKSTPATAESDRLHREAAGLRCAQSTPLVSRNGEVIGMISTYWKSFHVPSERELRFLDLLARQAADAIERHFAEFATRQQ